MPLRHSRLSVLGLAALTLLSVNACSSSASRALPATPGAPQLQAVNTAVSGGGSPLGACAVGTHPVLPPIVAVAENSLNQSVQGPLDIFGDVHTSSLPPATADIWDIEQKTAPASWLLPWVPQGGVITSRPAAFFNSDGRLEVFFRGPDCALWHIWQNQAGAPVGDGPLWGGGTLSAPTGVTIASDPAVFLGNSFSGIYSGNEPWVDTNGRLEVFALGSDGNLWHIWQTEPSQHGGAPWSNWKASLGEPNLHQPPGGIASDPAVYINSDLRLEVFVRSPAGVLWHIDQNVPPRLLPGTWSNWQPLSGESITGDPAVALNSDGRLEVFARGADGGLWHNWQTAPPVSYIANWSGWEPLGGQITSDPAVALSCAGRLEVFALGTGNTLMHIWQTVPHGGPWSAWASLPGEVLTSAPTAIYDAIGGLEVFASGPNNVLQQISQRTDCPYNPYAPLPPWSGWNSVGPYLTAPAGTPPQLLNKSIL
jgi:hypothetical protein